MKRLKVKWRKTGKGRHIGKATIAGSEVSIYIKIKLEKEDAPRGAWFFESEVSVAFGSNGGAIYENTGSYGSFIDTRWQSVHAVRGDLHQVKKDHPSVFGVLDMESDQSNSSETNY